MQPNYIAPDEPGTRASWLQRELHTGLKRENESLLEENEALKVSGRKEHFNLDSKIAVVALGKATIQSLEKEIEVMRIDSERI